MTGTPADPVQERPFEVRQRFANADLTATLKVWEQYGVLSAEPQMANDELMSGVSVSVLAPTLH